MAGNTKLMGFGMRSTVELQRWGKKTTVTLPQEAVDALRKACTYDLPKAPSHVPDGSSYTRFFYDDSRNVVSAEFSMDSLKLLRKALNSAMEYAGTDDYLELRTWVTMVESAEKDHQMYTDANNEPGIDDPDPVV